MLETRDLTIQGRWEQIAALDVRLGVVSELLAPDEPTVPLVSVEVRENASMPVTIGE